MTLRKSSIKVILVPLLVPLLKTVAKNPPGLRTKINAFGGFETPLSQLESRDFRTFFGAAFGATLHRDFVRIRSTLCKFGKSVYMLEI
jgi:hypothetical protein